MDRTTLLRFVSKYPHATRALIHSADNSEGYRCGHLLAISNTGHVWRAYSTVLFLHPDVYLLPRAVSWLHDHVTAHEADAFMVTNMFWNGVAGREFRGGGFFGTDLFTFRPPMLAPNFWSGVCKVPEGERSDLPERILYRKTRVGVNTRVLGNRTTGTAAPDAFGVWHSHTPADVVKWLLNEHLNQARQNHGGQTTKRHIS